MPGHPRGGGLMVDKKIATKALKHETDTKKN